MDDYDDDYTPISPFGYIGFQILFAIPVIGLLCVIIFSIFPKNHNVKNFARSQIIIYVFFTVFLAVLFALAVISGMSVEEFLNEYGHSI